MADNVSFQTTVATPASGTLISTEEVTTLNGGAVTAQHVQRIAVAIRTSDGVAIDLPGDSSNGLDVDVTRIVPGTGATNLGKAEDAAHSSGDTGVMALGVRQDADSAFGADGDYAPFQFDDNGFLKVNIKAGAGSGGTAMTDDAAFTPGTTSITPMGGFFDDVAPDSVNEGDAGAVRMSGNRNLYVQIRDAAGNERGLNIDANGALAIGSIIPGTGATNLGKAEDSAHSSGDTGVMALAIQTAAAGAIADNGDYSPLQVDTNGRLRVVDDAVSTNLTTLITATHIDDQNFNVGTKRLNVVGGIFDDTTPDSVDEGDAGYFRMSGNRSLYVQIRDAAGNERGLNIDANGALAATAVGNVAHDAADSGNPVKVGAKALAHGSNPTAVAAGDRTDLYANRHGIPFVISGHPNIITLRANYTAAQTDTAIITQGAGGKIVVTRVSVTADNANSVDVQARIGFGPTNTPTTTGVLLSHPGIAPGSGVVEGSGAGILGVGADGDDLRITSEVPTGGSIDVLVSYYIIES